jgi:hypothetical protein
MSKEDLLHIPVLRAMSSVRVGRLADQNAERAGVAAAKPPFQRRHNSSHRPCRGYLS